MSRLALSALCALGAAVGYAVSSVCQHAAASSTSSAGEEQARVQLRGLVSLLRRPLWLAGIGTDIVALLLHVLALSLGPVTLVQPLQVTGLLFALPLGAVVAARRVSVQDLAAAALVVAGLGLFLGLVRVQPEGRVLSPAAAAWLSVTVGAVTVVLLIVGRALAPAVRAALLAAEAGAAFAATAVLLESLGRVQAAQGWAGLLTARQAPALLGLLALGATGLAVSQAAFQLAGLQTTLPILTVVDPLLAVVLAAVLLGERVRLSWTTALGYALALLLIAVGVVRLARGDAETSASAGRSARQRWRPVELLGARALLDAVTTGALLGLGAAVGPVWLAQHVDADTSAAERGLVVLASVGVGSVLALVVATRRARRRTAS